MIGSGNLKLILLIELLKRKDLNIKIEAVIVSNFTIDTKSNIYLKRGEVHNIIANELNMTLNNLLVARIKVAFNKLGIKPVKHGNRFKYKHIGVKS